MGDKASLNLASTTRKHRMKHFIVASLLAAVACIAQGGEAGANKPKRTLFSGTGNEGQKTVGSSISVGQQQESGHEGNQQQESNGQEGLSYGYQGISEGLGHQFGGQGLSYGLGNVGLALQLQGSLGSENQGQQSGHMVDISSILGLLQSQNYQGQNIFDGGNTKGFQVPQFQGHQTQNTFDSKSGFLQFPQNSGFGQQNNFDSSSIKIQKGFKPIQSFGASNNQQGVVGIQSHKATVSTVTHQVPVPVPQPYPVTVTRPVPVPVPQHYPVPVPRPVKVSVPVAKPVVVPRPVPVTVRKPVPYPVKVPVKVPVPQPVQISVPQPYPVTVPQYVPVRVPQNIIVHVPQHVSSNLGGNQNQGYFDLFKNSGAEQNSIFLQPIKGDGSQSFGNLEQQQKFDFGENGSQGFGGQGSVNFLENNDKFGASNNYNVNEQNGEKSNY